MNYRKVVAHPEFIKFNNLINDINDEMNSLNHTMIGYNFIETTILSVKFYYVFFSKLITSNSFPIPELKEIYEKFLLEISHPHITKKYVPGGGITLTIKFDKDLNVTKGFFFRLSSENNKMTNNIINLYPELNLKKSDFDDGYGQYVLVKNNEIITNEYLYLKSPQKLSEFENKFGVRFSEVDCVEISSASLTNKLEHKFISIGGESIIMEKFKSKIPISILDSLQGVKCQLCCPAVSPQKKLYSIYAIGKFNNNYINSPIIEFQKKHTT